MKLILPLSAILAFSPCLHASIIAYDVASGTTGTQAFGNSLGMDFFVHDAAGIDVSQIGVFDSGSDGLNGPINVSIYDRRTGTVVAGSEATLNGTDGTASGGHRFTPLGTTVHLPGGFRGSIVANGYNGAELAGNGDLGQTVNGGGALSFVGTSRFGTDTGFPAGLDGGPANRYVAGSFMFDTLADTTGLANALSATTGDVGNQGFGGPLGIDFVVNSPIAISALGVFDSGGDGLAGTITAELWSRSGGVGGSLIASQTFTPGSGTLEDGFRFTDLATSIAIAAGEYTILGHGFNATDLNGNAGSNPELQAVTDDQNGAISFVGSSRFGADGSGGTFPTNPDTIANQYLAGSFQYTVVPEASEISLFALAGIALLLHRRKPRAAPASS